LNGGNWITHKTDNARVACHIAKDAGHSDASRTRDYGPAVKFFIDRYLVDKG
jgi:hypothetical protein